MVVWLSYLSGRALAAQARGALGSIPGDCRPFTFLYFCSKTSNPSLFHREARDLSMNVCNLLPTGLMVEFTQT